MEGDQVVLFGATKPAYILPENFADTLINMLKEKGAGKTVVEKVNFTLQFNILQIQPETSKLISELLHNSGDDINEFRNRLINWFNETMGRLNGWYKTKLRTILFFTGLLIAVGFNVDTIHIGQILAKDKQARAQLVSIGVALAKDSSKTRNVLYTGKTDSTYPQAVLDSGLAHVSNDIGQANKILGLGWQLDTLTSPAKIEIEQTAADYADLAGQIGTYTTFQNSIQRLRDTLKARLLRYELAYVVLDSLHADSLSYETNNQPKLIPPNEKKIGALKLEIKNLKSKIAKDSMLLTGNFIFFQAMKKRLQQLPSIGAKLVSTESIKKTVSNKKEVIEVAGRKEYNFFQKLCFIFSGIHLVGFILTAFALSFGAPFWFDILSKLVNVRGSGVKPDDKKTGPDGKNLVIAPVQAGAALPGTPVNTVNDFVDKAIEQYTPMVKKIPGVRSVFAVVSGGVKTLQVNVDTQLTANELMKQYPLFLINNTSVTYTIFISGIPVSQMGQQGLIINRSRKNGFGTLGCILKEVSTGSTHILSCWHVLKGNLNYAATDDSRTIVDNASNTSLAERWAGGIRDCYDYGLAKCLPGVNENNTFLKSALLIPPAHPLDFREVKGDDIESQIDIKYYDSLNNRMVTGMIYAYSAAVDINYIDQRRSVKDILLLSKTDMGTLSAEGNSGSIVFDQNHFAIAMIIGGDKHYTYAVKLANIFNLHTEMTIL
jgi:hypothetical protein